MNPEQRHGRNADLGQAHDAPGTLHQRQALVQARSDAVKAVEHLALRQARGKLPLPVLPGLCGIEPAAGVADWAAVGIMEADGEASLEESAPLVGNGIRLRNTPIRLRNQANSAKAGLAAHQFRCSL